MSPGAHRTSGGGQKEGEGGKPSKASGRGATAKGNHANFCSTALSILCIPIVYISFQSTEIGFCFLHVPRSAPNERRRTERGRRRRSVKSKWMRSNSKSQPCNLLQYCSLDSVHTYRVQFFPIDKYRYCFLHVPRSTPNKRRGTERRWRRQSVKSKWMRSDSKR